MGIAVKDLILQGAVTLGWARYHLWGALARWRLGPSALTGNSLAVGLVGFSLHLLMGVLWALLWSTLFSLLRRGTRREPRIPRAARARVPWSPLDNWVIAALANTMVIWTGWGITFPLLGLGPAPWEEGAQTALITFLSDLGYSLVAAKAIVDTPYPAVS